MSNSTRQWATQTNNEASVPDDGGSPSVLTDARAEMDRLFAVASKSFESMTEGNSQEFLRRSRQTGGQ